MWFNTHSGDKQAIALVQHDQTISYGQLTELVEQRVTWLQKLDIQRLALALDNGIEWVLFDLACQQANIVCIPVPVFFSEQQKSHLLNASRVELLICDAATPTTQQSPFDGVNFTLLAPQSAPLLPIETGKVTFTSGSTGTPKGVCLSLESQIIAAESLAQRIGLTQVRHLCLLPLATLLENIAGVYAPLLVGGTVILADSQERGFAGSALRDVKRLLGLISQHQPNTLILVPELLQVLVMACQSGWQPPASLQFIAVGGAHVSASLLATAQQCRLPVYQGYGLSECVSVVSLNTPEQQEQDSVGKPLAQNELEIIDGELVVSGNLFLGYMNQPASWYPKKVFTGDLVEFKGPYLYIKGRLKNILINSFGRNISPEWIEAQLTGSGLFSMALVVGDSKPYCTALLVTHHEIDMAQIDAAIAKINSSLPDYGQIKRWQLLHKSQLQINGLFTANGKLNRSAFLQHFADNIEQLYCSSHTPIAKQEQYDAII